MPRNRPERDLAKACTQLLEYDGWRSLALEPMARRDLGKGFGEPGMADYLYIRYESDHAGWLPASAQILWVEFKSPRGRVTKTQRLWHDVERKRGALTAIATVDFGPTVEGFERWYFTTGLARRIQPRRVDAEVRAVESGRDAA